MQYPDYDAYLDPEQAKICRDHLTENTHGDMPAWKAICAWPAALKDQRRLADHFAAYDRDDDRKGRERLSAKLQRHPKWDASAYLAKAWQTAVANPNSMTGRRGPIGHARAIGVIV